MLGLIGLLLVVWLAFIIIGAVGKGLLWLLLLGIVLFLATGVFAWARRETLGRRH